jgi:hypothetical protein
MKLLVLGGWPAWPWRWPPPAAATRSCWQNATRDTDTPAGDAAGVFEGWRRTGVASSANRTTSLAWAGGCFATAPDVCRALLGAGAVEVEQFRFLASATPESGDEDLATIGRRRPVFEAALRRAVQAEPGVDLRPGCR